MAGKTILLKNAPRKSLSLHLALALGLASSQWILTPGMAGDDVAQCGGEPRGGIGLQEAQLPQLNCDPKRFKETEEFGPPLPGCADLQSQLKVGQAGYQFSKSLPKIQKALAKFNDTPGSPWQKVKKNLGGGGGRDFKFYANLVCNSGKKVMCCGSQVKGLEGFEAGLEAKLRGGLEFEYGFLAVATVGIGVRIDATGKILASTFDCSETPCSKGIIELTTEGYLYGKALGGGAKIEGYINAGGNAEGTLCLFAAPHVKFVSRLTGVNAGIRYSLAWGWVKGTIAEKPLLEDFFPREIFSLSQ